VDGLFDPLSYENLAKSVVAALMERAPEPLPPHKEFPGPGVYAVYYTGDFPAYQPLAARECHRPIYVGKAAPPGGRKGLAPPGAHEAPLHRRLCDHAKSLAQAENLRLADFLCRYLVVVPVWVTLAERFLVTHYRPLWNTVVDGFGNHPPGSGRSRMRRPRWDILHPGRPWAAGLEAAESAADVLREVAACLHAAPGRPPVGGAAQAWLF